MSNFRVVERQLYEFVQSFPGVTVVTGQTMDGLSTLIKVTLPNGKGVTKIITINNGKTEVEYISKDF